MVILPFQNILLIPQLERAFYFANWINVEQLQKLKLKQMQKVSMLCKWVYVNNKIKFVNNLLIHISQQWPI